MDYTIGISSKKDPEQAVAEAVSGFKSPKLIIFFSPVSSFKTAAAALSARFPSAEIVGTTSHYTYGNDCVHTDSLCAYAFNDGIVCKGGVLEEIKRFPLKYAQRVEDCILALPSIRNCICLEFTSAFSLSEELALAAYDSICSRYGIQVAGGTAGMSWEEAAAAGVSYVSYNGAVYTDASVFVCIHNEGGKIAVFKENIFLPANRRFTATSVDVKNRIVREFDHRPAADVLAEELNCTIQQLPDRLTARQIGRVVNHDVFITAFDRVYQDKSVSWSARIYNHTTMQLLQSGNYEVITDDTIRAIKEAIPAPSFVFLIHCLARTIFYEQERYLERFNSKFSTAFSPIAGYSSLGEQLGKIHLNQTLLALVFE
ncbi:domain of unknown function DUF1745 [Treponema brennaborense DSM 12168]|uniref:FIST domain-containing protein n=2 Tax=Treponema TaxID=157 RepID=F4LQ52_TREBD|nr:domain of unknown function DUF1745 [Treponema brennaborense DSM 12168]